MDKYQQPIMATYKFSIEGKGNDINKECFDGEIITLKQIEDITVTKYKLLVSPSKGSIAEISAVASTKRVPFQKKSGYIGTLDFEDRAEYIEIGFKNEIADNLIIPIKYIEADKEAYYARKEKERVAKKIKKEQEYKKKLFESASITFAVGADLVNIYFQPCCEKYARTEITLYRDKKMLATYKVEEGFYFKAICELAYGSYCFVLKQYDKSSNVILETEYTSFNI